MTRAIDRTDQQFGRLTAVSRAPNKGTATAWLFQCACGNAKVIKTSDVTTGKVKSCGCLLLEVSATNLDRSVHGHARVGAVTRLHDIWRGMLKRCNPDTNPIATRRYAARGISVCPEWSDFDTFKDWALANGYRDDLTIERDDVDGNYEPGNCSWATHLQQCRNRRTTKWITIDGDKRCQAEWLEQTGTSRSAYNARLERGWSIEQALGLKPRPKK